MKQLTGLLLLLGLFCCRERPTQTGPRAPKIIPKDSLRKDLANPYATIDISPMDMSYLPVEYPKLMTRSSLPVARVIYSRPHKQGRKIFGDLLKYGEPWRLGANEATEIEFFKPVKIEGKTVAPGKYVMYCIPYEDHWVIAFNSNLFSWGLQQDSTKDVYRFNASVSKPNNQPVEYFTLVFRHKPGGADMIMVWDDTEGSLFIEYSED